MRGLLIYAADSVGFAAFRHISRGAYYNKPIYAGTELRISVSAWRNGQKDCFKR
jgi:hypothetical protein